MDKKGKIILLALITIILISFFSLYFVLGLEDNHKEFEKNCGENEGIWWNNSWNNKREISNLTGEIIYLNISYNNISSAQSDFDDIRFLNSTEDGELGYYLEQKLNSNWAVFRVKSNNDSSIYMYYNNQSVVSSNSNISDVYGSGLVSAYFLERTSGVVVDELGVNNGTATGGIRGVSEKIGNAYQINISDGRVNITDSSSFDFTNKISIAFWFKSPNVNRYNKIITKDYDVVEREIVMQTSPTGFDFDLWDTGNTAHILSQTYSFSNDTWYHIVGTYNGTTMEIYIDGIVRDTTIVSTFNIKNGTRAFIFGTDETLDNAFWMNGTLDEVGIWNRNLSSSEISVLYNIKEPSYVLGSEQVLDIILPKKAHSWTKITPGVVTIIKNFDPGIGLKQIQINVSNKAQNVTINITKHAGKPAEVTKPKSRKIYRYLQRASGF